MSRVAPVIDDMRRLASAMAELTRSQRDAAISATPRRGSIDHGICSEGSIEDSGAEGAERMRVALAQNRWLEEILGRFEEIDLPDSWLVAGCIAQTIWNLRCKQPAELGIKDVDLIYFDAQDLSAETETGHERRLRDLFRALPLKLDVKNEARVHLWYKDRFGYPIEPYSSSADAITSFPTTATSVGVRRVFANLNAAPPSDLMICSAWSSGRTSGR